MQYFAVQVCRAIQIGTETQQVDLDTNPTVPTSASPPIALIQPHILGELCHADANGILGFLHVPGGVFTEPVHAWSSVEYSVSVKMTPQRGKDATYSDNKISEKEVRFFSPAMRSRQSCLVATTMSKKVSTTSVSSHMNRTLSCFD